MKRFCSLILSIIILGSVVLGNSVAYAASETDTAASYLKQRGIFTGDENGNLNLDKGLTRAELAAVLTRLDFADTPGEWTVWGMARFSDPENRYNTFADIPNWALPYIEYCYQRSLMKGVSATQFDPQGAVTPKMVCTVMLRFCGVAETDWNYDTSVAKAQSIGIAPVDGMSGDITLRGTMAVIIYRSILYAEQGTLPSNPTETTPPQPETQVPDEAAAMTIDEMKAEIVRLTNIERVNAGLPELEVLPELMDCAQAKAQDFKDNNYFGHISPVYGDTLDIIKAAIPKAKSAGENLAGWTYMPQDAVTGWMNSQEHRINIVAAKFTHIGVGIIEATNGGFLIVQQFIAL